MKKLSQYFLVSFFVSILGSVACTSDVASDESSLGSATLAAERADGTWLCPPGDERCIGDPWYSYADGRMIVTAPAAYHTAVVSYVDRSSTYQSVSSPFIRVMGLRIAVLELPHFEGSSSFNARALCGGKGDEEKCNKVLATGDSEKDLARSPLVVEKTGAQVSTTDSTSEVSYSASLNDVPRGGRGAFIISRQKVPCAGSLHPKNETCWEPKRLEANVIISGDFLDVTGVVDLDRANDIVFVGGIEGKVVGGIETIKATVAGVLDCFGKSCEGFGSAN